MALFISKGFQEHNSQLHCVDLVSYWFEQSEKRYFGTIWRNKNKHWEFDDVKEFLFLVFNVKYYYD